MNGFNSHRTGPPPFVGTWDEPRYGGGGGRAPEPPPQPSAEETNALRALEEAKKRLDTLKGAQSVTARGLAEVLNNNKLLINQLMWMRLDPFRVHMLLKDKKFDGEPIGGIVDPHPIGVYGNYLALRWPISDDEKRAKFEAEFNLASDEEKRSGEGEEEVPEETIALPSTGIFGEAVLGEANSAEKIDLTRFWNWKDSPIPILPPEMEKVSLTSRARDVQFTNVDFGDPLAELKDIKIEPDSELDKALSAISKEGMFKDMSNADVLKEIVTKAQDAARQGATDAGNTTMQYQKNMQEFVKNVLDSEAAKVATKAAMTALAPEGEAATMLGGLSNLDKSKGGNSGSKPAKKPPGRKKPVEKEKTD